MSAVGRVKHQILNQTAALKFITSTVLGEPSDRFFGRTLRWGIIWDTTRQTKSSYHMLISVFPSRTPINAIWRTGSISVFLVCPEKIYPYPAHNMFKIIVNFHIVMGALLIFFISFISFHLFTKCDELGTVDLFQYVPSDYFGGSTLAIKFRVCENLRQSLNHHGLNVRVI